MEQNTTLFSQQLAFMGKGSIDSEITEALAEVVKAVRETDKQGTVTLTIKVAKLNKRDENAVRIIPTINNKVPKQESAESIMFSTADGDLLRDDPEQIALDLKSIPTQTPAPLKSLNG
jgi:hypothetical protein